jgi:hypothetical protein
MELVGDEWGAGRHARGARDTGSQHERGMKGAQTPRWSEGHEKS